MFLNLRFLVPAVAGVCLLTCSAVAQPLTTAPATPEDMEALYTAAVHRRAAAIVEALTLKDAAKRTAVLEIVVNHYRALRARDAVLRAYLLAIGKDPTPGSQDHDPLFREMSRPLHDMFLATLAAQLTPEQIDLVKDHMTYNKAKLLLNAYCEALPKLSEEEKAKVLEILKAAREVAMDGGSSNEKHATFEKYKPQINEYLTGRGHDVNRALEEWAARQAATQEARVDSGAAGNPQAN